MKAWGQARERMHRSHGQPEITRGRAQRRWHPGRRVWLGLAAVVSGVLLPALVDNGRASVLITLSTVHALEAEPPLQGRSTTAPPGIPIAYAGQTQSITPVGSHGITHAYRPSPSELAHSEGSRRNPLSNPLSLEGLGLARDPYTRSFNSGAGLETITQVAAPRMEPYFEVAAIACLAITSFVVWRRATRGKQSS